MIIGYVDFGRRYSVKVECNAVQATRIAKLLPGGRVLDLPWPPANDMTLAISSVLEVKRELGRIGAGANDHHQ